MVGYLPPLPGTGKGKGKRFPTQQLICRDKLVRFRLPGIWTEWGVVPVFGEHLIEEPMPRLSRARLGIPCMLGWGKERPNAAGRNRIKRPCGLLRAGSGLDSQLPSSVLVPSQTWLHALPWFLRVTAISFQKSLAFVQWYLNQKTCSHFWGTEF